jgi:hypothetical protein
LAVAISVGMSRTILSAVLQSATEALIRFISTLVLWCARKPTLAQRQQVGWPGRSAVCSTWARQCEVRFARRTTDAQVYRVESFHVTGHRRHGPVAPGRLAFAAC